MVTFGKPKEQKPTTEIQKLEQKIIPHKVTGFFEAKAKQEVHQIVCLRIGDRLRWIAHQYPKSTDLQFVFKAGNLEHTFGIDTTQNPLFEDEKARPVYLSILGSVGPGKVNGDIVQPVGKGNGDTPPANTDSIKIATLENQNSTVHNDMFEKGQLEAILSAGTRNAQPNPNPVWMQFLAFGGIPIGVILGILIAPYLGKALGGG